MRQRHSPAAISRDWLHSFLLSAIGWRTKQRGVVKDESDKELMCHAIEGHDEPGAEAQYFIEAELPIPETQTVQGVVSQ